MNIVLCASMPNVSFVKLVISLTIIQFAKVYAVTEVFKLQKNVMMETWKVGTVAAHFVK